VAAGAFELQTARHALAEAEKHMGRRLDTSDLPNLLYEHLEDSCWDKVAARCLSCANCTQVCPTCFCSDVVEVSDLLGQKSERIRRWDSCFNLDFSHVHGGNIRPGTRSRYRQWLTHKLASWIDQFGVSGCVGCGRCITWCPVGIDLTAEVEAIRKEGSQ
jgi:Fe-S oxidoreductase